MSQYPERKPDARLQPYIPPDHEHRRERVKIVISLAVLGPLAVASAKIAFEFSGVKPNIVFACGWWLTAFAFVSAIFWFLVKWRPGYKVGAIVASLLVLSLMFKGWAVEQYRIQHSRGPGVPWMEIVTLQSLGLPNSNRQIPAEMTETYREHRLLIHNSNTVDLRNFAARVQLPEPAIETWPDALMPPKLDAPPGLHLKWRPIRERGETTGGPPLHQWVRYHPKQYGN